MAWHEYEFEDFYRSMERAYAEDEYSNRSQESSPKLIKVKIVADGIRAIRVRFKDDFYWIPKSQIIEQSKVSKLGYCKIKIPYWLYKSNIEEK